MCKFACVYDIRDRGRTKTPLSSSFAGEKAVYEMAGKAEQVLWLSTAKDLLSHSGFAVRLLLKNRFGLCANAPCLLPIPAFDLHPRALQVLLVSWSQVNKKIHHTGRVGLNNGQKENCAY